MLATSFILFRRSCSSIQGCLLAVLGHLLHALHQLRILLDRLADGVERFDVQAAVFNDADHFFIGLHANVLLLGLVVASFL